MRAVIVLLLVALLWQQIPKTSARTLSQVAKTVNVCIPTEASPTDLTLCNNAVSLADTDKVKFRCVSGGSEELCMSKIKDGSADLTTLGASGILPAYQDYALSPLLAELYGDSKSPTEYYSVAVVNREFCNDPNVSLESLKGANLCSTGYRKTAGWVAPVGFMTDSGVIEIVSNDPSVRSDAQSVANFFGNVCSPRTTEDGPRADGTKYAPLCSGCEEDCSTDDKYYSYDGSFRCLMEGNGDVSFTKNDMVSKLALDGSEPADWATKNKDDFRLLCSNGGCKTIEDYTSCNFGRVPSHAIVGKSALGEDVIAALLNASNSPEFLSSVTDINGMDGFFLSDGTTGLIRVESNDFNDFFDPLLQKSFAGVKALQASEAQSADGTTVICFPVNSTTYESFVAECNRVFTQASSGDGVAFSCSTAPSAEGCMEQVKSGAATLTKLGPSDIFLANRDFGLEPVVSEYYGGTVGNSYYSVAVVKKEFCDSNPSVKDLQGKRSCHTGYRKTAGWTAPIGFLVDSDVIPVESNNKKVNTDAETVASFFSATCAVGSNADGPSVGGGPWAGLCTACENDCSDNSPYAGYEGTIRGLMEDVCDVAFTKQETAPKVVSDGLNPESWSTLAKDDLRLLCPLGGCKSIDEWEACNMAAIPAQAFVGTVDIQRTEAGAAVKSALVKAGQNANFLNAAKDVDGTGSYILTSDTKSLQEVPVDQSSYDYLGKGATQSYLGIQTLQEAQDADSDGGGLDGGAIAGIVIGCILACILIGGAVFIWYRRKSRGMQYEYQGKESSNPIVM